MGGLCWGDSIQKAGRPAAGGDESCSQHRAGFDALDMADESAARDLPAEEGHAQDAGLSFVDVALEVWAAVVGGGRASKRRAVEARVQAKQSLTSLR
jgi:hypothetical protein